jgi:nitrate/TMAO reductase-like tetraheme cytochrome c subunit
VVTQRLLNPDYRQCRICENLEKSSFQPQKQKQCTEHQMYKPKDYECIAILHYKITVPKKGIKKTSLAKLEFCNRNAGFTSSTQK